MRIIGGDLKGRVLRAPLSQAIRPTSDRARESMFNILAHSFGNYVQDATVLDLFAGTGALGLEALSRGALNAVFVDQSAEAHNVIKANIEALRLGENTRLIKRNALHMGAARTISPSSLIFCDPPYDKGLARLALESCIEGGWMSVGAMVVVEESVKVSASDILPNDIRLLDHRLLGETQFIYGKYAP
jgi:16S rRNA (guanine966-N2)-methyltransferase